MTLVDPRFLPEGDAKKRLPIPIPENINIIPLHPSVINVCSFNFVAIMADERSPLLQNGRVHDGDTDYSAVNEPEQINSIANNESIQVDAEQQQIVVAPQNSVITLVGLGNFRHYLFILTLLLDKGDTNGDRDILKCNGPNDYRGLSVTYSFTLLDLESSKFSPDSLCFYWKRIEGTSKY